MRGRIVRPAHRVARLGDDLIAQRDDGADRHLAGGGRFARQGRARGASAEAAGSVIARRLAQRRAASHIALLVGGRPWLLPAVRPPASGTLTVVSLVPTLTEPVSTSNAGACPPLAVTPLRVAETCGAFAPRIWLMSRKPVAIAGDDDDDREDEDEDDGAHDRYLSLSSADSRRCLHNARFAIELLPYRARNVDARARAANGRRSSGPHGLAQKIRIKPCRGFAS